MLKTEKLNPVSKEKGVVLIATGHRIYAQMAVNLCLSIKAHDRSLPVWLFHDDCIKDLNAVQRNVFTKRVELKLCDTVNPFKTKLSIYDLSPFDQTIYLDVDMLCLPFKNFTELFDQLKDIDFTVANNGYENITDGGYNDWINYNEIDSKLNLEKWLNCSSEFIYFKKGKVAEKIFKDAGKFYDKNSMVNRKIGNHQPDEPSITIALHQNKVVPHQSPFLPSFWKPHHPNHISQETIKREYYFLSMGGKFMDARTQKLYNDLSKYYGSVAGVDSFDHYNKQKITQLSRNII